MFNRFGVLNKAEKILVTFLSLVVLITGTQIGFAFYDEHSAITPVEGGIYIEGAIGTVEMINPLYVQYGTVTHDLTQLIFSGLTQYDPEAQDIVPDLADFTVSDDGKVYTFVIRENAKWHDGISVTANDVLFTFNTVINNPGFAGQILNYNDYSGMKVSKVDDRTMEFLLEEPDSFFLVKTITGLLPEHLLGHIPAETLGQAPFNQFPIGSGPYRFISLTPLDNAIEVTLEAFENFYGEKPHIPTIQIKVFPTYKELVKRQGEMMGIRNIPEEYAEKILRKGHLNLVRYQLPQYVAVFLNTQSPVLKNSTIRLALQMGTDKESLVSRINQSRIIDTPLLEIDQNNWVYQYSINRANGALHEMGWELPQADIPSDEIGEEEGSEEDETSEEPSSWLPKSMEEQEDPKDTSYVYFINGPNGGRDWQTTDEKITLTGTVPLKTKAVIVDDYELSRYVPGDPGWSYIASFEFENLKKGKNVYEVYAIDFNEEKKLIDAITVVQGTEDEFFAEEKAKLKAENAQAPTLPLRRNVEDEDLIFKLVIPAQPETYGTVAEILRQQWRKIGVGLEISVLENGEFQQALFNRDYDLLIFGQNLGYNLDAYPYWHSSQAKEGGYNLSQFKNFVVDSYLDKARLELDGEDRKKTLSDIQEIISKEVPAIFLYSPNYYLGLSNKIQNAYLENLATTSDRFATIERWYARVDRQLREDVNPLTFAAWIIKQF